LYKHNLHFRLQSADRLSATPASTPPELEQKESRQFKSKAPQRGQKGFPSGCDGFCETFNWFCWFVADAAVVCPWEEYGDVELSELAQFGTV
uniref:3',5'-cyclic-GMP phosphodiesterase n=1 Tax=Xiphophorus couchianus TaxID=32473 RepID=A0A3B5KRF2_9TELE